LIGPSVRFASAAVLVALSMSLTQVSGIQASAQTQVPAAPPTATTPTAPAPAAPVFPKPDPKNFTASSPTKETIDAFLRASWGYEDVRIWQVQAILKTQVDGISKVIVLVGDKTGKEKPAVLGFFALPDGKHIIAADQIVAFGENPFADFRTQLQQQATGPYRGAASKELELVEFADFQCPHCKEAQANMDKLMVDFPKARIVFENDPIATLHPQSVTAASYGVCVASLGGSTSFFQFASAVFDGQDGLATADGATLTLNSAVAKVGLDPAKVAACAATPATKETVDASVKLAIDMGISQVPMLVINGRQVPANTPYETLKKIVEYQAKMDGVTL
jgi:protein-disulfide isomerase